MALKCTSLLIISKKKYLGFGIHRAKSKWFSNVDLAPPDPLLGLTDLFNHDENPTKVNLGPGVYRDDDGKPFILSSVRKAELIIYNKNLDKEYAPITGIPEFKKVAMELALGKDNPRLQAKANATVQGVSGTGSLCIGAHFLSAFAPNKLCFLPAPTWVYHNPIFVHGGLQIKYYTYFKPSTCGFDFEGAIRNIKEMPEKSIILLHACAHNPTGVDPKPEQWAELSKVIKSKKLFPFFDMAYQGFTTGDVNKDAFAVRLFLQDGHEIALAQSFSKNMGLYGERTGTFSIILNDSEDVDKIMSQLRTVIVPMVANCPIHGPRIATEILTNKELTQEWLVEVKLMADRIINIRKRLKEYLKKTGSSRNWEHITDQIGMFCYTGLTTPQSIKLTKDFHIYLTQDGRIAMAAVNSKNVEYVAHAMHEVTK